MPPGFTGILPPQPVTVTIALEPVYNSLVSMAALSQDEETSGLSEWVLRTTATIPAERLELNLLLFWGIGVEPLTNVVARGPATESFPAYLAALEALEATALRDGLLYWKIHSAAWRTFYDAILLPELDVATALADPGRYLNFLEERSREKEDPEVNQRTIALLQDAGRLKTLLLDHLHWLWENKVAAEWERVRPLLAESVEAFAGVNLTGLTILEAIQAVTGRDLRVLFRLDTLLQYRQIRFFPTVHNGPYLVWFGDDDELRMTYAARRPEPTPPLASRLDHTMLANRLSALADEMRLQILLALRQHEELSTQDLIERFDLNKSAASRHLRQLFANNLILERREDGAKKIYSLNRRTLDETVDLLSQLGGKSDQRSEIRDRRSEISDL
jgi:DNA-binding transcriptional ArsR family regulator